MPNPPTNPNDLQRKFEVIFNNSNDAIFIIDLERYLIVDCNDAATDLVGHSKDELLEMPVSELHPHNFEEFTSFAEEALNRGEAQTDKIPCYDQSGDIVPVEMSAETVELNHQPHLINHVHKTRSQTDQDWFETLIEHSQDLITVIDSDGRIKYQTRSIKSVLGHDVDDFYGSTYYSHIHPDDKKDVIDMFNGLATDATTVSRRIQYRFRRANKSWAWLESAGSFTPDGPVSGIVINSREITDKIESYQQAAVLNRAFRHNLRNSLTVIHGQAEKLAHSDNPTVVEAATKISNHANTLQTETEHVSVFADLLDSRRVSQQQHDLSELVPEVVAKIRRFNPDAEIEVYTPTRAVAAAAPKLSIAIEHVVENAVEHNDTDTPKVTVSVAETTGDSISITVADNGPGIPDREQEVLLEGEEDPLHHSIGFGLWIVNWIITRSGGHIRFASNEPRGSRVVLTLPQTTE